MKKRFTTIAMFSLCVSLCFGQYNYGLEVEQHDAKIDGILNLEVGVSNIVIGDQAGTNLDAQSRSNTIIGKRAGEQSTSGSFNVFLGYQSGRNNIEGEENTFIGPYSGFSNTISSGNTQIGFGAGISSIGETNTFLGSLCGYNSIGGSENVFVGYRSGYFNDGGNRNTFLGFESGFDATDGSDNTFLGFYAANNCDGCDYSVIIGSNAGFSSSNGDYNTYIGYSAGKTSKGSNNVFIGSEAGIDENRSNKLHIDNSSLSNPLIFGEFDNEKIGINWDETLPLPATLSINGTAHISETLKLKPQVSPPIGCNTQAMGSMYVDNGGVLYFCNGASWKVVQLN